jgi:tRNA nucleotidyltransferase (CCA-adding enzyme)
MPTNAALAHPDQKEMVLLLEKAISLSHQALLRLVAEAAASKGLPLYIVGGFVRDLFVGHPGLDFDLVVEGDAVGFARSLAGTYGGRITTHFMFGTATWEPDGGRLASAGSMKGVSAALPPLDFITARSETYPHPGTLPVVKPGSLQDDLCRRDFSINTLALRLEGERYGQLEDRLGGLEDLRQGCVRVLHPESYLDDPTRILRAVRYEQRYAFQIAPADLDLIRQAKPYLGELSGERLRHELDLVLAEVRSAAMLARLQELDILNCLHPLLAWDETRAPAFAALDQPEPDSWTGTPDLLHQPRRVALSYLVWLGALEPAAILELASRLDFTASLREALLAASELKNLLASLASLKPSEVVAKLDGFPLLVVCAASLTAEAPVGRVLDDYLAHWRQIRARTTGDDLVRRGLPPGPAYKTILWSLRAARLDGEVQTEAEESGLLERLIKENF